MRYRGELDLATSKDCFELVMASDGATIELDLAETTFIDCAGYRAIVAARSSLHRSGRSLEVVGAEGEPAYLLSMVGELQGAAAWSERPWNSRAT